MDIVKIRDETPASLKLAHFNNAGSSLNPTPVTDAVLRHLRREQEIGGYEAAAEAAPLVKQFYLAMAELLSCQPGEIAFIENATRAWELALYSIPLNAGDEIITFPSEYASNYMGLTHLARQKQLSVKVAPLDHQGLVDLQALTSMISDRTRLIALTHIASQRGDIQPATQIGKIAREYELFYLLDGCQSAGQLHLNVYDIGCDFLAGTGRKYLRGPRGTGFLYVNQARFAELDPVFVDLHSASWEAQEQFQWQPDARRFENFERHLAGMIGLGIAADYANQLGTKNIESRILDLTNTLREKLTNTSGITLHERSGNNSGIVTFSKEDEEAAALHKRLQQAGINTSVAKRENARFDLDREDLSAVLRASIHYYNTEDEIARLLELLQ